MVLTGFTKELTMVTWCFFLLFLHLLYFPQLNMCKMAFVMVFLCQFLTDPSINIIWKHLVPRCHWNSLSIWEEAIHNTPNHPKTSAIYLALNQIFTNVMQDISLLRRLCTSIKLFCWCMTPMLSNKWVIIVWLPRGGVETQRFPLINHQTRLQTSCCGQIVWCYLAKAKWVLRFHATGFTGLDCSIWKINAI